jgi:hypothetical protein
VSSPVRQTRPPTCHIVKLTQMLEGMLVTAPARDRVDTALVKALARAHRGKRMLEEGRYASINAMAGRRRAD